MDAACLSYPHHHEPRRAMSKSSIEWTEQTWNPVTGCTRVSRGCDHCYAATMTRRLEAMGQKKYAGLIGVGKQHFNGAVKLHPDALDVPLRRKKPTTWFVNSMSDLFHPAVPFDFIDRVFAVMAMTSQHTFQILTKRPERMAEYFAENRQMKLAAAIAAVDTPPRTALDFRRTRLALHYRTHEAWPLPNVWLGTSIEDQAAADERVPHLLRCPAAVRFLSCEPLLGQIDLRLYIQPWGDNGEENFIEEHGWGYDDWSGGFTNTPDPIYDPQPGIHWVIAGGESGPKARPMHPEWVRDLRDQCTDADVPFFLKQWGAWAPTPHPNLGKSNEGRQICFSRHGREQWLPSFPGWATMERVGKKAAGRMLDGRIHDAMPMTTLLT